MISLWVVGFAFGQEPPPPIDDPNAWHERLLSSLKNDDGSCWDVRGTYRSESRWNNSAGPGRPSFANDDNTVEVGFSGVYDKGVWSRFEPDALPDGSAVEDDIEAPGPYGGWLGLGANDEGIEPLLQDRVESWWVNRDESTQRVSYAGQIDVTLDLRALQDELDDGPGSQFAGRLRVSDATVLFESTFEPDRSLATEMKWTLAKPVRMRLGLISLARVHRATRRMVTRQQGNELIPVRESGLVQVSVLGTTLVQKASYSFDDVAPCTSAPADP